MKRAAVAVALMVGVTVIGVGAPVRAATPTLGPVHTVGQSRSLHYSGISVAFDGTNHLVVWMASPDGSTNTDIRGARVARNGTILDAQGIRIATTAGTQHSPDVSFDGTNFLVAWENDGVVPSRVEATRVSGQGVVLDAPALDLGPGEAPEVATASGVSIVVWDVNTADPYLSAVRARRIGSGGAVLDAGPGLELYRQDHDGGTDSWFTVSDVASNGTDFMVLAGRFDLDAVKTFNRLVPISRDGDVGPDGSLGSFGSNATSIASNGTDYLVAGQRCVTQDAALDCVTDRAGHRDIYTVRVTQDLVQTPGADAGVGPKDQRDPRVTWSGGRYLVAYWRRALECPPSGSPCTPAGPIDVAAVQLNHDGSTNLQSGFIAGADVYGTNAVAPGRSGGFAIVFEDLPSAGTRPVQFRTVSPK